MSPQSHVVMYSGGIGSWAAAKRVAAQHGTENLTLLFTDTKSEHPDTYRFLRESAANVGGRLVEIADGRTIWEVFRDVRFLGNHLNAPCSRILKGGMADAWIAEHFTPETVTLYVGIDWTEEHRFLRLRERRLPWRYEAPLCDPPYVTKDMLHEQATAAGIAMQALYKQGAAHANCGGGCVRMGHGGFARLLRDDPCTFAAWEANEATLRAELGPGAAILNDRSGDGKKKPMTLAMLRARIESGGTVDLFDIGGCGCFVDEPEAQENVR